MGEQQCRAGSYGCCLQKKELELMRAKRPRLGVACQLRDELGLHGWQAAQHVRQERLQRLQPRLHLLLAYSKLLCCNTLQQGVQHCLQNNSKDSQLLDF